MTSKTQSLIVTSVLCLMAIGLFATCKPQPKQITLAGSRSVGPIVEVLAERYREENPDVTMDVQGGGSSTGIIAVRDEVADIGMSSRALKDEERDLVETIIAYDGVALVVNPQNRIDNLSTEQARQIFAGETTNWNGVGGSDGPITIIDKEIGSGTKDVFEDAVMGESKIAEYAIVMDGTGAARAAVSRDPNAIGYISFAAVTDEVKVITIDRIEPTPAEVQAGRYRIFRPFVLVTKSEPEGLIKDFVDFMLSDSGQAIVGQNDLIRVQSTR